MKTINTAVSNKRLLLFSNSTNYNEDYLKFTRPAISNFLGKDVKNVVFVPYAGITISYDEYAAKVEKVFNELGYNLISVHKSANPIQTIVNAEAIVVGGGNTFQLVYMLQKTGLLQAIKERAIEGVPYIGWSAGSNVASPSLKTTNDMPVVEPYSFEALSLVPFQINPHYTDEVLPNHNGETREQRLKEFMVLNPSVYVVGLKEGTALIIEGLKVKYLGVGKSIKIMKNDFNTLELNDKDKFDFLLT